MIGLSPNVASLWDDRGSRFILGSDETLQLLKASEVLQFEI
jgi:hypothetical protein